MSFNFCHDMRGKTYQKGAATYSPALRRSTIGAPGLNFSVRDGKRWNTGAKAAQMYAWNASSGHRRENSASTRPETPAEGRHAGADAPCRQSRRAISSARLRTSPPLHLRPIDVVVCDGPVRPNLAEGFALRCTQRLSAPGVATLRCAWRHSRQTSGRSVTVLSY